MKTSTIATQETVEQRQSKLAARRAHLSAAKQAKLEKLLKKTLDDGDDVPATLIQPRPASAPLLAAMAQERLWFLDQLEPGNPAYNIPMAFQLSGKLQEAALRQGLSEILHRHESLRTNFLAVDGSPTQIVAPIRQAELAMVDLGGLSAEEVEVQTQQLTLEHGRRPFSLTGDPLLRTTLLHVSAESHVLVVCMHHIVSDGWSIQILMQEMASLYKSFSTGAPSQLPPLAIQYTDFAHWQRDTLQGATLEKELSYWRNQLQSSPPLLNLPTDRPRPAAMSFRGSTYWAVVDKKLTESLRQISQEQGVTLFVLLLAAFYILLGRYSGDDEVAVGTPVAGRRVETERLIGLFINTLVLRAQLDDNPMAHEFLGRVQETVLEAQTHQDVPFEKLVEQLRPARSLGHAPLFQVMFALQNIPTKTLHVEALTLSEMPFDPGVEKFDLTLNVAEEQHQLKCAVSYSTDLFDEATVQRMTLQWQRILEGLCSGADARILDIPLLNKKERQHVLHEWNQTAVEYPDRLIHECIEEQAARTPETIAVQYEDQKLSYAELNRNANRLAHHLTKLGIGMDVCVGICAERSLELVTALVGILKAGGAYIPFDPSQPAERLVAMIEDARPPVVLTQRKFADRLKHLAFTKLVVIDDEHDATAAEPDGNPGVRIFPESRAYVIYTSGSTGQPKGAMNSHDAIRNRLVWMQKEYQLGPEDRVLQKTPLGFDVSVWEFFWPLMFGARLVMARPGGHQDPDYLRDVIAKQKITTLHFVPSMLRSFLEHGPTDKCTSLRRIICSGEALTPDLARQYMEHIPVPLYNLYGPTEAAVDVTHWHCRPEDVDKGVPIGKPIANTQTYVLDRQMEAVPVGVPGELYLGGAGLARGYLNSAALTAEKFVPNPFAAKGARLYRTGDWARWREDGNLDFLGRKDHQVKLRGNRIELGEIESVLRRHEAVRDAAVVLSKSSLGDPWLLAYVVPSGTHALLSVELRKYVQEKLPDYMAPSIYMELAQLPLTSSGKLDRRNLPDARTARPEPQEEFIAPKTPIEQVLAGIWESVLGVDKAGRGDNFFWIGGHSLLATRVVSRIRDAFQIEMSVRTLFESPVLTDLAVRIEVAMQDQSGRTVPPLTPALRTQELPLSFAQQRLWFLDQLSPNSNAYNISAAVHIETELNVAALEQSIADVVRRHETLRTTFPILAGHPRQVVMPASRNCDLPLVDLSGLADEDRTQEALRLDGEQSLKPFDLANGSPLRMSLAILDREHYAEIVTVHHIVSDAWSMDLLKKEIESHYGAFSAGQPTSLPPLEIQYADYAVWQRQWMQNEVLNAELGYWRRQLAGAPLITDLATDFPRPNRLTLPGALVPVRLSASTTLQLNEFSRKAGATVFMTLMAVFQALLARYTGQDDILVGTPISGRNQVALESLIGLFVNTVVLRTNVAEAISFRDLVAKVRESALGAYAHQDLPFDKIVEEVRPERMMGRNPLFQTLLVFQNQAPVVAETGAKVAAGGASQADTKFDLESNFWETENGIAGSFIYSPELFMPATVTRMVRHFETLLSKVLADPDMRLSDLTLMNQAELRQVVQDWNQTTVEFPANSCVHELFAEQAAQTPDAIALESTVEQVTYEELDLRANRLANYLRQHGVGPEVFVGVLVPRSVEMIVALLAISKAGGVYVPINVVEPAKRIGFIIEDAGISVLLTVNSLAEGLDGFAKLVRLDEPEFWKELKASQSGQMPHSGVSVENLIYMLYTSGSTGIPKGVCVNHRSVLRLVKGSSFAAMNSEEVYLQFTPSSFDVSTFEIWGCLLHGGRLVLHPPATPSLGDLGDFIARTQITTMWLTGGLFHQMVESNLAGLSTVSQLLAGGEALSPPHVYKVIDNLKGCKLINGYGPTEATTFACCYDVEPDRRGATVPIGRPIANTTAYILTAALQPVAVGERGELYIGGVGVARGYFNRPDLTAARFVPDPFSGNNGDRLYRTGDLCRYLEDGNIEFLGRVDNQIKLRGLRIELGEIEAELMKYPAVRQAVVLAREDTPGNKILVAYLAADAESGVSSEALKGHLKGRLPDYMVPAVCVVLKDLPLNANGKLDKSALPAPDRTLIRPEKTFVGARDALEQQLVQMWEEILAISPIGVHDDFFELGGHSLVAVQLVARIEERLGKRVPMAGLFQEATIERLAQFLREETTTEASSLIVPIQPKGDAPSLFCVHAAGGHVFCYAELSRYMGQEQPLYGIQEAPNTDQISQAPLESLAADYVHAIMTFQPSGPYFLAGWSLGGMIAFEIARQLEAKGQQMGMLAVIDAEAPDAKLPDYNWVVLLGSFAFDLGIPAETLRASWSEIASFPPMEQLRRVWIEAKTTGRVPVDITLMAFRKLFDSFKAKAHMMRSYAGGMYQGKITLFRAEQPLEFIGETTPENYYTDTEPTKGWKQWAAGGVEVYTMPGQHHTIMREPYVKALAEQLRTCVQDAAKGPR